jgi:parallel beta-helix repeat protein
MRIVIIIALLFFVSTLGFSATINVPGDYKTIQAAIDAAVNGDTVLVEPGTYLEYIDYKGKAIIVTSSDGPVTTVIDANTYADVVTFENGEGLDSVLTGFTITNGFGIRCFGASPTITNNLITGCLAYGISCLQSSSPEITRNRIHKNWQGINVDLNSSPMILSNIIDANDSVPGPDQGGTRGSGIYAADGCSPMIINNIICGNRVYGGYNFVGYWIAGSGGGIYAGGAATLINNTVYGNQALSQGGKGGGIYAERFTTIVNSIFWKNDAEYGFQISGGPDVTYSDVQGGWSGTGNIDSDPLFVDLATGDYHLTYPSPCRDAGDNSVITESEDFEGDPRIAWGGTVDMGADEFFAPVHHR